MEGSKAVMVQIAVGMPLQEIVLAILNSLHTQSTHHPLSIK